LRLAEGYSSTVGGLPWRPQAAPPPEAREWRLERTENLGRATWVAGGQLQGRSVFAVAARKEVRILDAATGVALRTLRSHAATTCAAFLTSEQRNWVAAAREDGSVGILDVDSAELLRNLHFNDGSVGYLRFAEVEGMPIVVAGDWDSLGVWDAVSGEKLRTVEPKDSISSIAVGHDGHRSVLALGTRGRRIILYDLETGETIKTIGETTGVPHALALAALDGELMLVSGGTDTIVRLQSVETGRVVRTFEGHLDWVRAVEVMEEGGRQLLVSAGDDNAVRFWNVRTGESLATGVGHQQWVRCVAGVALGDRGLVASGGDDGTIRLWELESGEPAGVFGGPMGWSGVVSSAGPDERLIAALIGDDNKIEIWDVATSRLLHTIMAPNSSGITLSLHEVKQRLLLAWTGAEARVLVWDALTADLLHSSIVDSAGIRSAQIVALQDGPGLLMVSNAGTATLTDLSDGKVLQSVEDVGSAPFPAFFLLHGQPHLVHTSDDGLTVRSMVSGTTARRIETDLGPLGAMSVVEIGGEPHLAAIGNRGIVKIWKPATGRLVRSIDMQGRRVNSLEHKNFEGRDLLGWSSEDGWIGAYDLADGKSVFVHNTPSGWANSLSLGRVGKNLVCVSADEDGIAAFRWIESGQITRTTMVKHGSGIAVTVVPGTDGNDRIVAADPEAWKCFRASYRANGSQAITGIDDMPRAEAAPD
ncbi:MAG TPA: WD40 repeat domain-containing protein, partial [Allosphingosinicella sp.]|nr:WD40 repeat domain-containing protein [Allosphingosinicella sp.]